MGGLPSYLALRSVDFELFDQYFKAGKVPRVQPHLGEAFKEGTIWDHTAFLKLVLPHEPKLREGLRNGIKVLDIGSGAGGWSIRLAKQFPNSTFVGIDPDSNATTKGMLQVEEFDLKNVNLEVGNAELMEFSGEFDAAYLGEVLCLIASTERVLRSCFRALRSKGTLVICEGLVSKVQDARKTENQLVHAMQLDFALQGGKFFTKGELRNLLQSVGLRALRFYDVGGGLWFMLGQKP